jgi:pimeloyl-ACP methyl ester carboxylesterase
MLKKLLTILAAATLLAGVGRAENQMKNTKLESGMAAVNGTRLYYEVQGEGRPIVLIHGGLVDRRMWDDQFDVFAKTNRVVRYDLRGYEKSDRPTAAFSHIQDLHQILMFLKIQKTAVIGLSLGGQIAIDFTLVYPEMVEVLIPVSSSMTGFPFKSLAEFTAQHENVAKLTQAGKQDEAVEALLKMSYFIPYVQGSDIQKRMRPMLKDNLTTWMAPTATQWPAPTAYERLEKIAVPTLIIVGDKDTSAILDCDEYMARKIPGARKIVIPDTAHHLNMEKPAEFNRIVLEFLNRR